MTKTAYTNMNLYDGEQEKVTTNSYLVVDDETGKITALGTETAPTADKTVDLAGKYVMPGLINCHDHMIMDPDDPTGGTATDVVRTTVNSVKNLHTMLKSGVTYVRECGSTYDVDITIAHMIDEGKITRVPEVMPSGRPYSMTGGHGDMPNFGHLVDSPDEMRKAVRQGLKKGAKSIKVMATGGVMTQNDFMTDPQLSVAEIHAAVEEAHHKGLIVAAHAEGNPGIMNAIKAGVDSIEHGFYVNDEEIDLMLKQGTYLTPTVVADWAFPTYAEGKVPDWEIKKASDALGDLRKNITHAKERGVKITLGTDAGTPFNDFSMTPIELQLLAEQGFTNYEALRTSVHSAQLMKIDDEYGTLAEGKYADFLVLDGNPLDDIKAVAQEDKAVYKKGRRAY
ncbi:amidohydrolase family protein [Lactobacillus sp. ESL0679]|uniref:metal-dependent hydrolase family protein n=1 Tax=Lactobacillus sp. ESL0679 TaxID=2983209 RepID=UPI0023F90B7F|nr:amidohydrolase family protein [Lactobacillus sp. ESL0679]MDF7683354.1 amidohydrolase family protein [Lactobacillus sp. ESL0679]